MKIANAADLVHPAVQQRAGAALAAGEDVTTPLVTPADAAKLLAYLASPELDAVLARYRSDLAQTHVATLHPTAARALGGSVAFSPAQQLALGTVSGVGFGALTGAGAAAMLEAFRAVSPKSAAVLTLGASLFGAGLGGLFGSRVISEFSLDVKKGVAIKGQVA